MNAPTLTPRQARLVLDHLDNVQATSLSDDDYREFWAAKRALIIAEFVGKRAA